MKNITSFTLEKIFDLLEGAFIILIRILMILKLLFSFKEYDTKKNLNLLVQPYFSISRLKWCNYKLKRYLKLFIMCGCKQQAIAYATFLTRAIIQEIACVINDPINGGCGSAVYLHLSTSCFPWTTMLHSNFFFFLLVICFQFLSLLAPLKSYTPSSLLKIKLINSIIVLYVF